MIAYLKGIVFEKLAKSIILETGDIGYEITVATPLLEKYQIGQNAKFFIHTHVREDDLRLYGVETLDQLKFFKMLIEVPGIGPKLATDILAISLEKIQGAILNKDLTMLQSISGIGKKIAERLIVELKNKVELLPQNSSYQGFIVEENEEAMTALINLGYQRKHVMDILKKRPKEMQKTEDMVRYFLQNA